jgi:hypothetical protein
MFVQSSDHGTYRAGEETQTEDSWSSLVGHDVRRWVGRLFVEVY